MRDDAETRIQKKAVAELVTAFVRRGMAEPFPIYHGANEGKMPVQYRKHLKDMGQQPGFPDLLICLPCPKTTLIGPGAEEIRIEWYNGAALELKAANGYTKPEHRRRQAQWLDYWARCGFYIEICKGHQQTATTLARLGYIPSHASEAWIEWAVRTDPCNV